MDDLNPSTDAAEMSGRRDFLKVAVGAGVGAAGLAALSSGPALAAPSSANLMVYHIEERRSFRVLWLMEELGGLPYKLMFTPGDMRKSIAAVKALHPMAMVPTIVDGDLVMVESGAILQYIIDRYGEGRLSIRAGQPNHAQYLQWMYFAEGSASPRITADYTLRTIPDAAKISPFAGVQIGGTERVMRFAENTLAKQPYFAGPEFTAADIMMQFPFKAARLWGVDFNIYPHVGDWMHRMETRPGFLKAEAKGSPGGAPVNPASIMQPLLAGTGKT
jgi:glutathione S-transferase